LISALVPSHSNWPLPNTKSVCVRACVNVTRRSHAIVQTCVTCPVISRLQIVIFNSQITNYPFSKTKWGSNPT